MVGWDYWAWLTYACIGIAALMPAISLAVNAEADLALRFARISQSRWWRFTPAIALLISAVLIGANQLGFIGHQPPPPPSSKNVTHVITRTVTVSVPTPDPAQTATIALLRTQLAADRSTIAKLGRAIRLPRAGYVPLNEMAPIASIPQDPPAPDHPCLQTNNTINGITGNGAIYVGNAACNNTIKNVTRLPANPEPQVQPDPTAPCPPGTVVCDHGGKENSFDCVRGAPGSNVMVLDKTTGENVHDVQGNSQPCPPDQK